MLIVDESANSEGNGVKIVLISPLGEETKLAMQLKFQASNNEAEYEALLIELRVTQNIGVT